MQTQRHAGPRPGARPIRVTFGVRYRVTLGIRFRVRLGAVVSATLIVLGLAALAVTVVPPAAGADAVPVLSPPIPGGLAVRDTAAFRPSFKPAITAPRLSTPILIDGKLDDPGWSEAARATGFAEVDPGDQVKPPVESEAWIAYDEKNLYVALIARDDPRAVRVSLRERDNIFSDDYFGVMIDTYGDHAWGYEFFVNPLGIQGDLRIGPDGNDDPSLDLIWFSRGKVTDTGWQAEIAIPFASIRFPDREEQTWRVNFWRDHRRDLRRRYAWAATNRDDPCWMCQWGTLTGIRGIKPARNLEVIAGAIGYRDGVRSERDNGDPGPFRWTDPEGETSLNLRYGISSNVTGELTINPDFSQIESDAGRISVNEPFALFYSERRPFFQEGTELYNTWITAIYTRSIANPALAAKVTGKFGGAALAATVARDDDTPILLPMEERSFYLQGGRSTAGVVRLRAGLGEDAHVGGLLTVRGMEGGGSGTVFGFDAAARVAGRTQIKFQQLLSHTVEPRDPALNAALADELGADPDTVTFDRGRHTLALDGEVFDGHALFTGIERNGRDWNGNLNAQVYHPGFRAADGFVTRTDFRELDSWNGFTLRPDGAWLVEYEPSVAVGRVWDYAGRYQDEWLMPSLSTRWRHMTDISFEQLWSRERFREIMFPGIRRTSVDLTTRFGEALGLEADLNAGRTIWRTFDPAVAPLLARMVRASGAASIKLGGRVVLGPEVSYLRLKHPDGRSLLYDGYILRNRLDLQLSRAASFRLVTEYDKSERSLGVEPLLTYRLNAFSVVYLGVFDRHYRYELNGEKTRVDPRQSVLEARAAEPRQEWQLGSRQLFAKVQYLWRV
jgi:hypothetical protein